MFQFFFVALLFSLTAGAQNNLPFAGEIAAFKKADSLMPPPQNAIVFTGSSSFRLWSNLQQAFPNHTIINRGFGGSTLVDMLRYEEETIFAYNPKQVVIYCGENDLGSSDTVTANMVLQRFQKLFTDIRQRLPQTSIVFVSIKPSPSRWRLKQKMVEANSFIKKFLATKKKTAFVNVWNDMLDGEGKPNEALFREDKLHMTPEGYAIWQQKIEPKLVKK